MARYHHRARTGRETPHGHVFWPVNISMVYTKHDQLCVISKHACQQFFHHVRTQPMLPWNVTRIAQGSYMSAEELITQLLVP